ncbi:AGAP009671-PA-like protein [Anopheles sinensis]|uniref:AGAP009671-PA-like protein n=2 Tax=Anopheles sinensis TaxID=74873 RepID=A0A084VH58_ANOSI|nr:AGAP009671-PA-like protein [Anopheles sinensis]
MHDIIVKTTTDEDFTEAIFLLIDYMVELPRTQRTRDRLATLLGHPSNSDELKNTLKLFENVIRKYCVGELDEGQLRAHFSQLPANRQQRAVEIVNLRKPEIAQRLIDEVNRREGGVPLVESFDWDVSWVMGSSSLASLRKQLCTVVFACRDVDSKPKTVSFEMEREQVDEVIRHLEAVV